MSDKKKEALSLTGTIILACVISFFIVNYLIFPLTVVGESMEPTVHDKSYALSNRLMVNDLERFDIVAARVDGKNLIKRVIALPGETVTYEDNTLYINGKKVSEDFLDESIRTEDFTCDVPDDSYFLMGDNREVSLDSRYYGAFKKKDIIATNIIVLYPFSSFGRA